MPTRKSPRKGSLQFWPRKRAAKFLPSVNWNAIDSEKKLKGFICYKAGMKSAYVKDNTPNSMTQNKGVVVPVTILECPHMRIFSVRFYKNKKVVADVLVSNDKDLKRKVKVPKELKKDAPLGVPQIAEGGGNDVKDYDDVRVIVYSLVKKAGLKKTPDMIEVGLSGSSEDKLNFVKENIGKDLSVADFFAAGELIDIRGLTKGKGLQGPVRRFGITLKSHKSEKGQRRPGNIGPWHPARVTFRVPMAGQLGMFTRVVYNNKVIEIKKAGEEILKNLKNYGDVKNDYLVVAGSIQGPSKRQLVLTNPLRKTKKQEKKAYELVELR